MSTQDELLTVNEFAERVRLSPFTVYRRLGHIPHIRIGRTIRIPWDAGANTGADVVPTPVVIVATADGSKRTSRGYITGGGVQKIRLSLHLTKAQCRRLKHVADDAGETVSDYVARMLL